MKKALILGGTDFFGPALVKEILTLFGSDPNDRWSVTLFHRGIHSLPKSYAHGLRDDIHIVHGDRNNLEDMQKLKEYSEQQKFYSFNNMPYEVIIDSSGQTPSQIKSSTHYLKDLTDHYIYISSISVYDQLDQKYIDEKSTTYQVDETQDLENDHEGSYAYRKMACENYLKKIFNKNEINKKLTIIRPGIIVGPRDSTWRFPFWVSQLALDKDIMLPKTYKSHFNPVQVIDVFDLAKWTALLAQKRQDGLFNAVGNQYDMKQFLEIGHKALGKSRPFNINFNSEGDYWTTYPLTLPQDLQGLFSISNELAVSHGLKFRSLEETFQKTWKWIQALPPEKMTNLKQQNFGYQLHE